MPDQLVGEHIADAVVGLLGVDVTAVEDVAGSVANQDFRIDLADGRRVFAKVAPHAEVAAEVWALGAASAVDVPVPTVLGVVQQSTAPRYDEPPRSLLILDLLRSDGNLTSGVLHAVGRALAATHSVQVPGFGGLRVAGDVLNPDGVEGPYSSWAERVAAILRHVDDLVAVGLLPAAQAHRIHHHAEGMSGSPLMTSGGRLLHADLKPHHILAIDGVLTGVIDWGDAGAGDPAWDLARASMMAPDLFRAIVDGYPGADDPEVTGLFPIYRVLWNAEALNYEYCAGGDWFAEYQRRISSELDLL